MADENVTEETPVEALPAEEGAVEVEAEAVATATDAPAEEPAEEAAPAEKPAAASKAAKAPAAKTAPRKKAAAPKSAAKPKREKPVERKPIVRLEKPKHERGRRPERQGTVVSDAMDKTIVVKVDVIRAHPKYKKVVRRSVKFHAHDEGNEAKVGDVVRIVETRPLSATKNWRLAEIVEVAK